MMDALQYAQATQADVLINGSTVTTVTPDYFMRSVAYTQTEDYEPDVPEESRKVTPDPAPVVVHSQDGAVVGTGLGPSRGAESKLDYIKIKYEFTM